jgi:hypothetical protein
MVEIYATLKLLLLLGLFIDYRYTDIGNGKW